MIIHFSKPVEIYWLCSCILNIIQLKKMFYSKFIVVTIIELFIRLNIIALHIIFIGIYSYLILY